jgi:hypothetical protein
MNPFLINYLQNNGNQGQQQEMDFSENQPSPDFQPQQPFPQPMRQQPVNNPFDVGIQRAIESARESLGMTDKQQDKALRRSLLAFGNNMAQQPVRKGFWNNFGAVSRSVAPAILEYDDAEERMLQGNNQLANQILAYGAKEEAQALKNEENAWKRQYAEDQLAEQRRYHDMRANPSNQFNPSNLTETEQSSGNDLKNDQSFQPISSKNEINSYAKDKKALGSVLQEITELEDHYKKFRKDYTKNLVDPMSPFNKVTNPAKDLLGRFTGMSELRQETADRKTLGSQLNKFVVSSERALKGGGVMGPTLIKMFKEQGIYPDLDNDTPEIFESKLKMLKEEIENSYKAANLSLNYGVRIDPSQVGEVEKTLKKTIKTVEKAINPVQPVAPMNPNQQEFVGQPVQPIQPMQPGQPIQPIQPNQPVNPANPNEQIIMVDDEGFLIPIAANELDEAMALGLKPYSMD